MPAVTFVALLTFIFAKIGVVPAKIIGFEIEILLFIGLAISALIEGVALNNQQTK